ncbi:MAG: TIGR04282 family arsenosugar biosynthesis glycosyltransferase [Candidatus Poribacteria bacterium]|nr:TIGR04282 family arsenosugar biosynthesis glycosyltransferase [Candidatus Poribacteria bacterium]
MKVSKLCSSVLKHATQQVNVEVSTCLIVFTKNPIPNQVKTRLLPELSPEQAASLYRAFLIDWCETLSGLSNVDLVITYTPPGSGNDLQALIGNDVTYIPQIGTNLGTRLTSATQWASENGYEKILIVGSDSPTLPLEYILQAVVGLDSRDIVIGPSVDGGYYLIGFSVENLNEIVPSVFEEIAWSTPQVLQQTVERIRTLDATLKVLPPWYDVDTPEDLSFLLAHLSAIQLAEGTVQAVRTHNMLFDLLKENS